MSMVKKIERWIFLCFIASIPIQLRLVLYTWNPVTGVKDTIFNEWSSSFLWATDILLFLAVVLGVVRMARSPMEHAFRLSDLFALSFLGISLLSIGNAEIANISWYRYLKLIEYLILFFYIRISYGIIYSLSDIMKVIIVSGFFQAGIAIIQSLTQSSLGLWFLGEPVLKAGQPGVAVFEVGHGAVTTLFMRAYGTMPHPNLLSVWLFIALWSCLITALRDEHRRVLWYEIVAYIVILYGFLLTFSRVAIGMWGLSVMFGAIIFIWKLRKRINRDATITRLRGLIAMTAIVMLVFTGVYWSQVWSRIRISRGDEAVRHRILFMRIAERSVSRSPFFGLGIGQFVPDLMRSFARDREDILLSVELKKYPISYLYQPVHSIYLLIASELGVLGVVVFLFWMGTIFVRMISMAYKRWMTLEVAILIMISMMVMGAFDHFFWTLQQGGFMLWGMLAFADCVASTEIM